MTDCEQSLFFLQLATRARDEGSSAFSRVLCDRLRKIERLLVVYEDHGQIR